MSSKKTSGKGEEKQAKLASPDLAGSAGRIVSVLTAVGAFVAAVMLYRFVFPPAVEVEADVSQAQTTEASTVVEDGAQVAGVSDPWTKSGTFSTGYEDLDEQVKTFCDAFSKDGLSAQENARNVYNNIVWGAYVNRAESEAPGGANWDVAAARQYLSTARPEAGEVGEGDVYDYAAITSFCLRYFGYGDAIALPVVTLDGSQSALCLVTNGKGYECVVDPTYGTEGWMLDRYMYSIVVDDIGQDLSQIEARGLTVKKSESRQDGEQQTDEQQQVGSTEGSELDTSSTYDGADGSPYDTSADSSYGTGYDSAYDSTYESTNGYY